MTDPFHSGEIKIQEQVGVRDAALRLGRLITERIPAGAVQFLAQQEFCALGWTTPNKDLWSGVILGHQGFAQASENGSLLSFDLTKVQSAQENIFSSGVFEIGDPIGTLFIDLSNRRRLRVNGTITHISDMQVIVSVAEAFPNCPKYIQRREVQKTKTACIIPEQKEGNGLTEEIRSWITQADTFFVTSAHLDGRTDVSHRGGAPGFVHIEDDTVFIPDYHGNNMFGTLGNFAVNPIAGLTFIDFATGQQLQLTGSVQLALKAEDVFGSSGGTNRWWRFKPEHWKTQRLKAPISWALVEPSPFNP